MRVEVLYVEPDAAKKEKYKIKMKEELINRFKAYCHDNYFERRLAVETQGCRIVWESTDSKGLVRIKNSTTPQIMGYFRVGCGEVQQFDLTIDEYVSLAKLYSGGFRQDAEYAKALAGLPHKDYGTIFDWHNEIF